MQSKRELPVPSSCKVRHLWDTLFECLMNPSSRCDKAIVVGSTCYCRHPNRSNFSMSMHKAEAEFRVGSVE